MRMNIMLDVGSSNPAFGAPYNSPEDDGTRQREVARMLRALAHEIAAGYLPLLPEHSLPLLDANGKRVGVADVFKD